MYICIPSYKRFDVIGKKSIKILNDAGIFNALIFVVPEEYDLYKNALKEGTYGEIIVGRPGLVEQRKFIMEYCPADSLILMMDDDIEGFVSLRDMNIKDLINYGFDLMGDCNMWGVSSSANRFFLKDTESTNLKYIIGCFYGIRNVRPILELKYGDNQEDKERTCRTWLRDGKILRLNWIAPITKYYATGGMMSSNPERKVLTKKYTESLCDEFPTLIKQIAKKDIFDIRFRRV